MILVLLCTLAQVPLGTYGAVNMYMRSFLVWWGPEGSTWIIPVFPGGSLVGFVLTLNLLASTFKRLKLTWAKAGLWLVHIGLILLVSAEFVSAALQVDDRMAIEQGQTVNYVENSRSMELAIVDVTDPAFDEVFAVPATVLAKSSSVNLPGSPITLNVKHFFPNAELTNRSPVDPPSIATMGIGPSVKIEERAISSNENEMNNTSVLFEPVVSGRSYGVWLASIALGAPQSFTHEGHTYTLSIRPTRHYLPYALTLKKFSHDKYAGTEIPKNFSSLVQISNPSKGESRDVLIYMNQPLRYEGRTFYQASFGKGDTLSILQVVENPGWLLPYISCVLVTIGLLVHFAIMLRRSLKKRQEKVS
ncbi:MAG: cytochrome c biogenesis protein ResB [Holophagaceae bacterium]|nr:cytochrome c biogenesis protein ResB [Holophagaceae bacterium]